MRPIPFEFDEEVRFISFNKHETVVIIDGDVMCYIACKPLEPAWKKKRSMDGFEAVETETFDEQGNKIEAVAAKPKPYYEFTEEESERYLEQSWEHFVEHTLSVKGVCDADFFLMAMKSDRNYRDLIYPKDPNNDKIGYKATRTTDAAKKHKNPFVPKIRQLAIDNEVAIDANGREADDFMRIWAEEARECGDSFVIGSIDKDLSMIHGRHFNLKKNVMYTVTEKYALRFYYEQLLKGDPTDNIPGLPKIGPIKATEILDPYETEHEFQAAVIDAYQTIMGDKWENHLLANGKLLYLQKHVDDHFHIRGWARFG